MKGPVETDFFVPNMISEVLQINEKDIPAKKKTAKERTRFSQKDEHRQRSECSEKTPGKGKEEALRINSGWSRLKSGRDFERVFARGRFIKDGSFIIYYIPRTKEGVRIGICTGKALGNAVKRNRIKRQIREILRQLEYECGDTDLVIVARKSILDKDFLFKYEALKRLLPRALLK